MSETAAGAIVNHIATVETAIVATAVTTTGAEITVVVVVVAVATKTTMTTTTAIAATITTPTTTTTTATVTVVVVGTTIASRIRTTAVGQTAGDAAGALLDVVETTMVQRIGAG